MFHRLASRFSTVARARAFGALIVILPLALSGALSVIKQRGSIVPNAPIDVTSPIATEARDQQRQRPKKNALIALAPPGNHIWPVPRSQEAEATPADEAVNPDSAPMVDEPALNDVDRYLWAVYQRSPTKRDSTGDFTWKDIAAAAQVEMSLEAYVIGGMDPDFRELLYHAGLAMDAAGIHWAILSAFRDDYRQSLAAGYKAHGGNSLHGGSFATGGYGHGCAVDIVGIDGNPGPVWQWLDMNTAKIGLRRPFPRIDPAHIQVAGAWRELADRLRGDQSGAGAVAGETASGDPSAPGTGGSSADIPTERDMDCLHPHHLEESPVVAKVASPPQRGAAGFKALARANGTARRLVARAGRSKPEGIRLASVEADEKPSAHSAHTRADRIAKLRPHAPPRAPTTPPSRATRSMHRFLAARARPDGAASHLLLRTT